MNTIVSRTCGVLDKGPQVLAGCCQRPPRLCSATSASPQGSSPQGSSLRQRGPWKCAGRGKRVSKRGSRCLLQPSLRRDLHHCGWVFSFRSQSLRPALHAVSCRTVLAPKLPGWRQESKVAATSRPFAPRGGRLPGRHRCWHGPKAPCLPGAACRLDTVSVWAPLGGSSRGLSWQDGSGWQSSHRDHSGRAPVGGSPR